MATTTMNDKPETNWVTPKLPLFTRKDISEENKKSMIDQTQLLVPIGNYVCDAIVMYNILMSDLTDHNSDVFIKNRKFSHRDIEIQIQSIPLQTSPYVGIIGVCKFLGVQKDYWKKLVLLSRKGGLLDIKLSDKQKDFHDDILNIIEEFKIAKYCSTPFYHTVYYYCDIREVIEDGDSDLEETHEENVKDSYCTFKPKVSYSKSILSNLETWRDKHMTMESKNFKPVMLYQDKEPFPKPFELPASRYQRPVDEQKKDIIIHCKIIKESMKDEKDEGYVYSEYGEALMKSCDSQIKTLSMVQYPLDNVTNNSTTTPRTDMNKRKFKLPSYTREGDLMAFLKSWEPFDCKLPDSGYAWHFIDGKMFTETLDDIRALFHQLIAREYFIDTKIDSECAWNTVEENVIKHDKATDAQVKLIATRGKIPNFWDPKCRKKKYLSRGSYTDWFDIYSESIGMFTHLVEEKEGQFPTPFKDKYMKYFKDDKTHYDYYLRKQVPEHLQKERRDKIMEYFIETYHFKPDVQKFYSRWVERVKEAEKQFQAICDNFIPNPTRAPNPVAIFVPDSVFDHCDKPEDIIKNRTTKQLSEKSKNSRIESLINSQSTNSRKSQTGSQNNLKSEASENMKLGNPKNAKAEMSSRTKSDNSKTSKPEKKKSRFCTII